MVNQDANALKPQQLFLPLSLGTTTTDSGGIATINSGRHRGRHDRLWQRRRQLDKRFAHA
jgi:hypothetical protein